SVMCRNYGISMLLLFAIAAFWRERLQHPLRLAVLMAVLANTNAHSILIVGAILVMLLPDLPKLRLRLLPFLLIVGAGVLYSAVVIRPDATSVIVAHDHTAREVLAALVQAVIAPTGCFERVVGRWTELGMRLGYFLLLFHFARKPRLAASLYLAAIGFTM